MMLTMKPNTPKHWLRLLLFVLVIFGLRTESGLGASQKPPVTTVSTSIGPFSSQSLLNRAVLQALEKQIARSPSAHIYWVRMRGRRIKGRELPLLFYRRQPVPGVKAPCGIIWLSSGLRKWIRDPLQWVSWATDADIHALSKKGVPIQTLYELHPRSKQIPIPATTQTATKQEN